MIVLHRTKESPTADWIEAELQDMLLGYTVEYHNCVYSDERDQILQPYISDGTRMLSDKDELIAYFAELRALREDWCWYESDTCYIDDQGNSC